MPDTQVIDGSNPLALERGWASSFFVGVWRKEDAPS